LKVYYPILWALFILALSISPSPNLPEMNLFEPDKLAHLFVYGVLVYLALQAYKSVKDLTLRIIIVLISSSVLYGLLLEIVQKNFFPNRYFEWGDVIANTVGSILGWIIFSYFNKRKSSILTNKPR
jgi:VanZ family protein